MRSHKISLLFVSGEFFSMSAMNNLVRKKYNDAFIVNYSIRKCWVSGQISGKEVSKEAKLFYVKNEKANYILSPVLMLLNVLVIFTLSSRYILKLAPKTIISDSYILPVLLSVYKLLGFTKRTIYIAGDWHVANKNRKRLISYFANAYVFPLMDYLACKCSNAVLNYSDKISEARYLYWKKKIARKEKTIVFPFLFKVDPEAAMALNSLSICYLGLLKADSGLDIAISSIKDLRKHGDFNIIVIGPYSHSFLEFKELAEREGVDQYVKFNGFVEREDFKKIISGCFCGISMVKDKDSYTSFTFQGKIGDYLQYLLPVVASKNIGLLKDTIEQNNLGVITDTDSISFTRGVLEVYNRREEYRRNIIDYIRANQDLDIDNILGLN